MRIPFLDLGPAYEELRAELDAAYERVLQSGWYILGPEVEGFERDFAAYCGAQYCIGVANGLDALQVILRAYGIRGGDEVIVPAMTAAATWMAVSCSGATPVPVDCDPRTQNLDPERLATAIGRRTRAIIAVHLFGQPADMDPILEIGHCHGLRVIEDAAQSHGARYKGRRVGTLGDAAAFSLFPTKNLGAFGDAGVVITNDGDLADRVRLIGNYGSKEKYNHEVQGINSRLDALQAALLRVKLRHLDAWNHRRRAVAGRYLRELASIPDLVLPFIPEWADPVWHLFVARYKQRDDLRRRLASEGVETLLHYPVPPHLSPAYAERGWKAGDFPVAEAFSRTCLSLPISPHVTDAQVSCVISSIRAYFDCHTSWKARLHPVQSDG